MSRPLRVGHIKLSFHDAASEQVELVLRSHGHEIERSAAPHKEMFAALGRGGVDLLVAAWLPWSHGAYYAEIADLVRPVTVLYQPQAIWAVPDYVPAEVVSIEDLLRPPALDRMDRLIQGMAPGAGISEMSPLAVRAYGLDAAGYHFENGTEDDCLGRLVAAVAERKWIVVPFWRPQALHRRLNLRHLADPKAVLGGTDNATVLVRKDAEDLVGLAALADLAGLHLGNPLVELLDEKVRRRASNPYTDYSRPPAG
ncbi:glycine betaine/proline transport system substrate-binding protein [Actinacidiphila alni]|uniref:Glycine betaine/proline transport system substrate-binding protein n=1 Tax=Actinacidiphila alni TaxID=380248 RepID=A0A1I2LQR6_9ACTN|nr:glycine betaine ABC transporter substrate-binding protein [Actinacidiphila alni]SFF81605.1 glycine betaine/proline transport system substrate-binding protein [Actinacidiphila alni]